MAIDSDKLPAAWEPLVKRLAGVADRECGNRGFAVMTIDILVMPNAEPAFYTEPRVVRLEPRLKAYDFMTKILSMMGESAIVKE